MAAALVEPQKRLIEVEERAATGAASERAAIGEEKAFRAYDPEQVLLMAPVLSEWVPEGDLAHFVSDLVETSLDLGEIYASYEGERGYPPYDPRLMLKLLIYGYATGTVSSRKLERATYRDVGVRMLVADQHPGYRSVARFRRRHLDALAALFVQALRLCQKAGLVKLGTLAIDGTKLRANASRHKAMSYERMGTAEAALEVEIAAIEAQAEAMLEGAEEVDQAEDARYGADRRGDELPDELARRSSRLARIREAKAALEAEEAERERARHAEAKAERRMLRKPHPDDEPPTPKPSAQRNFTDPESKIMKTSDGAFHQCFNGQAVVDSHAQVIVAADASDEAPDARQLKPALEQLDENLGAIAATLPEDAELLGDAGYFSQDNVTTTAGHGLDPYLATGRFKHTEPQPPAPRGRVRNDATPKQRMARKLRTKRGQAIYKRRKAIVEPVFGQMDTVQAARQLLLRGKATARAQWRFNCAVHNLLKLHRAGGLQLAGAT
ncbi:MAG: IS1182 family transposase [Actinobacteria bacterium]|nr:IS1182 family transposase [Actinomycetota bacterium]